MFIKIPTEQAKYTPGVSVYINKLTERRLECLRQPEVTWARDQPGVGGGAGQSGPVAHLFLGA